MSYVLCWERGWETLYLNEITGGKDPRVHADPDIDQAIRFSTSDTADRIREEFYQLEVFIVKKLRQ